MSAETFRLYVTDEVRTTWEVTYPNFPIQWENHKIQTQPDGPWLDIDIRDNMDAERTQLGNNYYIRKFGVLDIAVHVIESTGTKQLGELLDFIKRVFGGVTVNLSDGDRVIFEEAIVKHKGLVDGYYYHRVVIPYLRTECKQK